MQKKSFEMTQYAFYQQLRDLPFIEKIVLFGSRARGDNQPRSDIDLAIVCPQATPEEWLSILDIIENADTLLKIDCIRFDTLTTSSPIKKNITSEGTELYVKTRTSDH